MRGIPLALQLEETHPPSLSMCMAVPTILKAVRMFEYVGRDVRRIHAHIPFQVRFIHSWIIFLSEAVTAAQSFLVYLSNWFASWQIINYVYMITRFN